MDQQHGPATVVPHLRTRHMPPSAHQDDSVPATATGSTPTHAAGKHVRHTNRAGPEQRAGQGATNTAYLQTSHGCHRHEVGPRSGLHPADLHDGRAVFQAYLSQLGFQVLHAAFWEQDDGVLVTRHRTAPHPTPCHFRTCRPALQRAASTPTLDTPALRASHTRHTHTQNMHTKRGAWVGGRAAAGARGGKTGCLDRSLAEVRSASPGEHGNLDQPHLVRKHLHIGP